MYNKLVDFFREHELFYIIGVFYFTLFSTIAVFLAHPTIGVQNENRSPARIIGEQKKEQGSCSSSCSAASLRRARLPLVFVCLGFAAMMYTKELAGSVSGYQRCFR